MLPITPGRAHELGVDGLIRDLQALRDAGCDGVLLREPGLSDKALHGVASFARDLFVDGWVGLHDRAHIALAVSDSLLAVGNPRNGSVLLYSRRFVGPPGNGLEVSCPITN